MTKSTARLNSISDRMRTDARILPRSVYVRSPARRFLSPPGTLRTWPSPASRCHHRRSSSLAPPTRGQLSEGPSTARRGGWICALALNRCRNIYLTGLGSKARGLNRLNDNYRAPKEGAVEVNRPFIPDNSPQRANLQSYNCVQHNDR